MASAINCQLSIHYCLSFAEYDAMHVFWNKEFRKMHDNEEDTLIVEAIASAAPWIRKTLDLDQCGMASF